MTRRFINQLGEHENIEQVFLVTDKQMRTNRNGNLYLQMRLTDRTGSVSAMLWNANDQLYRSFEIGDYVQVQAATQFYNGALQMIAQRVNVVDSAGIDESDFLTLTETDVAGLVNRLGELLRSAENYHVRCLGECFLMDESFMARLTRAPAGIKHHHAYTGGLLEHVVGLMELVEVVAERYPQLDRDVLIAGAFLHDLGKIDELTYDRELGYSDEGQLIGHLIIGVELLNAKIEETRNLCEEPFPESLRLHLKHMILSHHGQYEFGSPKLPMTSEALALHMLDNLDAKLHAFEQLMSSDANSESQWTAYQPSLNRKLYKPRPDTAT